MSERIVRKAAVVVLIPQVEEELEIRPIALHNPMSVAMREKGAVNRIISRQLIDALAAGEEDEPPFGIDPHEDVDVDEVPGTVPLKNARTTSPRKVRNRVSTIPPPKYPRATSSSLDAFQRDEFGPPRGETIYRGPGPTAVATTSQ